MTGAPAQRVVVAGASLGGLRAAEGLRAAGFTGEVVVVGDEPHMPYNRPPLSKEALAGDLAFSALEFRRRKSVDDVTWRLGSAVAEASLGTREVVLADGSVLPFDGLVVATGLRVRRLTLPAPEGGRHAVRTLEDAVALRADLRPGARVVVIGAGFIGCEVAATAVGLGCEVDVVAPEDVPMQRPLGPEVGAAMQRRHEAHGVRMHLGRLPAVVEARSTGADADPGRVGAVVLDDGTRLPADVVVEALGCVPNTEWLAATGLDIADGVRTDGWMRALDPEGRPRTDVVAVGDVARFPNALFDDVPRRVEHWSIPTDTAKRAAPALVAGLAGADPDPAPFAPMPSFWSDQYGARIQSFGSLGVADTVRVLEGDLDGEFVAGYERGGELVGVVGVGLMPSLMKLRAEMITALQPR
ncbi:MAG: FAD-dependent oxidoreductase [Actinobacteria bacterium]|nr:FAD-dependent oxidoreductase [Actinomycetota bacterium]